MNSSKRVGFTLSWAGCCVLLAGSSAAGQSFVEYPVRVSTKSGSTTYTDTSQTARYNGYNPVLIYDLRSPRTGTIAVTFSNWKKLSEQLVWSDGNDSWDFYVRRTWNLSTSYGTNYVRLPVTLSVPQDFSMLANTKMTTFEYYNYDPSTDLVYFHSISHTIEGQAKLGSSTRTFRSRVTTP